MLIKWLIANGFCEEEGRPSRILTGFSFSGIFFPLPLSLFNLLSAPISWQECIYMDWSVGRREMDKEEDDASLLLYEHYISCPPLSWNYMMSTPCCIPCVRYTYNAYQYFVLPGLVYVQTLVKHKCFVPLKWIVNLSVF